MERCEKEIEDEQWQGRPLTSQWEDKDDGRGWFDCATRWEDCPTELVRNMEEIYQRLVPTRVDYSCKLGMRTDTKLCTKLSGREGESLQHIFIGYLVLTQTD